MLEKIPEIKKDENKNELVFEITCTECAKDFQVFITPTADKDTALAELKKIQETGLCPNCRK